MSNDYTLIYLTALEKAVENLVMLSVTDHSGNIIHVNDYFCDVSQYSRDELIGKTHSVVKSGIHGEAFYREIWGTIGKGKIWKGQICNKQKSGEIYWVDTVIIPVTNPGVNMNNYLSVCLDITEKKNYEGDILRRNAQLQELIHFKDGLIHTVSHDLKGPLATIQGLFQLFREGLISPDELLELSEKVEKDIEHARSLLQKLENWSAGKF
ncbi:MAG: PAS domain S-box protein [Cyclobacteriaceae bacterium]|nr:PAS domain S-box protein [Cyclobacteriaceae bacterium]